MGKKWEYVAFADIRIGDVVSRTVTLSDGTVRTTVGAITSKGSITAQTEAGFVLVRNQESESVTVQRRVVKPKLPVEPGTVIDAEVVRSWRLSGMSERRDIRLIRGRANWVGMEHGTGWQFIAEDENIKKWTLVAAPGQIVTARV